MSAPWQVIFGWRDIPQSFMMKEALYMNVLDEDFPMEATDLRPIYRSTDLRPI